MFLTNKFFLTTWLFCLTFNSVAQDVTLYGRANVTIQNNDQGEGAFTEFRSNNSRIGVKGNHELASNLQVIFQAEFNIDLDGDDDNTITNRSQFIGLAGDFGQVLVGRNDTVLKLSSSRIDLFNNLNVEINRLWVGENRLANTLSYNTPVYHGISAGLTYIASEEAKGEEGVSYVVAYGDQKLKDTEFYSFITMDSNVEGRSRDNEVEQQKFDAYRLGVQGRLSNLILGAIYHQQEGQFDNRKMKGLLLSAQYNLTEIELKFQMQTAQYESGDDKMGITIGADYNLSDPVKFFMFYSTFDMDTNPSEQYLGLGIEYKF